ncbi:Bulb-type lectin domain [Sesbania bispinosa]|nr:Bulb-type lectin domain [Sesbania bispinosa]
MSLTILTLLALSSYISAQNVSIDETLIAGNNDAPWLSPSGDFALGFHQLEKNNLFLVAIWYHKIPDKTLTWYANGDNPAPKGSKLVLNQYRGLVLTTPQEAEIWRSQSISGTISYGLMNDTGNFQLFDKNSQVLWDTFRLPTDTLLPTQIMEVKGTLSSRQKETNFSKGRFQFRLLEDGNAVLNPINLPTNYTYDAYYISGTRDASNDTNSGYRVVFDKSGFLYILRKSGERFDITSPNDVLSTDSYYYRATIHYDGVFTISHHPKSPSVNQSWTVVKTLPDNICMDLRGEKGSGVCGFNSICTLKTDQRPICRCPEGGDSCWKKKLPLSNGREDRAVGGFAFIKLRKNNDSLGIPQTPFTEQQKKYSKDQDTLITAGRIDMLVDNDDEAINDMKKLERFVMVAIWCLQEDPSLRPTMKKVMLMLEGIAPVTTPPSPCPFTSVSVN